MTDTERFKLLSSYKTPRIKLGTVLTCEFRDTDMIVVGYSDDPIPWPLGRRRGKAGRAFILFGDLAEAVRTESNQAVCHWFGVTGQTVSHWRKALDVGPTNDGTHRLRSDYTEEPWARKAWKKAKSKSGDPERRRKIAEARKGKPRPAHVIEAMRKGRAGKPQSAATRAKMSAAQRSRSVRPAWTEEEDNLCRQLPAPEASRATGRSMEAVYCRRAVLGVSVKRTTDADS